MLRQVFSKRLLSAVSSSLANQAPKFISTSGVCSSLNSQVSIHKTTPPPFSVLFPVGHVNTTTPLRKSIVDPLLPLRPASILPGLNVAVKFEPLPAVNEIQAPPFMKIEKQAARMVVIRKRKMKKHKLRKLRKRMKYVYLKINQRRKTRKEKAFQDMLMAQITEAEQFDPKVYVEQFIQEAKEEIVSTRQYVSPNKRNPARYNGNEKLVTFASHSRK